MDMRLEVVVVPVSDVDRAKAFYERLGFRLDIDHVANEDYRVIQFTAPGSEASIIFGKGVTSARPGSIDRLVLAVYDIDAARGELLSRGVEVSEVFHDAGGGLGGGFHAGPEARAPGPDPQGRSYASYASFSDPDGNGWLFQEITERLPGRVDSDRTAFTSSTELAAALRRAATAHGEYEKRASTMQTGRTGTPSTSSGRRPGSSSRHERRLRRQSSSAAAHRASTAPCALAQATTLAILLAGNI